MNEHFIYRLGSSTNRLGSPPSFYRSDKLITGGCRYASVYAVREEDAEAINQAGTAGQFKGIVWSQRLWVDFDDEVAARAAQGRLKQMEVDHVVYTTGGRGCHVGILRDNPPSHTMPLQDKQWVKENLPGADLSLYWHLHLIRLPGTLHERTGQPKKLLYSHAGRHLTLPPYTERQETKLGVSTGPRTSLFTNGGIAMNLTFNGGSRHAHMVKLAVAVARHPGSTPLDALWLMTEVNRSFPEPKTNEELERIVRWAYE